MWIFLWIILWSIYLFIESETQTNPKSHLLISAYFLFSSVLVIIVFKDYLKFVIPKKMSFAPFAAFLMSIAFSLILYYALNTYFQMPQELISIMSTSIKDHFALQGSFLVSKFLEVLFQQTLIILLTGFFTIRMRLSMKKTLFYFLIVFGTLHLLGLFVSGIFGGVFLIGSIFAAMIFPYLISRVEYGFVYSYIIHYLFHVLIGPFAWLWFIVF
jgi:hypothetical protein